MPERVYKSEIEQSLRNSEATDVRWLDQKVTFDNLYLISRTVDLSIPDTDVWFHWTDLTRSGSLGQTITREYGKPKLEALDAKNEYDKFIGQPLNTLAYAGVLETKKQRRRMYRIADAELLKKISASEDNARAFLIVYIESVLKSFGWWHHIERYLASTQSQQDIKDLKRSFLTLLQEKMGIGTRGTKKPETETNRIFPKMLNLICFDLGARGVEQGRVMKTIPSKFDLIYNRPNFRDKASGKLKNETRKKHTARIELEAKNRPAPSRLSSIAAKVQKYHGYISEADPTNRAKAVHVHHIFPKAEYPELADQPENLIVLTPGQHYSEAHVDGNTREIDPVNQKVYLFSKLQSVKSSVEKGDDMYSYAGMARVLEFGYRIKPDSESLAGCHAAIASKMA